MTRDGGCSRRCFVGVASGTLASFVFGTGCTGVGRRLRDAGDAVEGRLSARPRDNIKTSATTGERAVGLGRSRDGIIRLPPRAADAPLPLFVMLHGAGQSGAGMLRRVGPAADEAGVVVLAPDSRDSSWDAIRGSFGDDVTFINRALERVFDSVAVDPARIAVGGFSDGATYALSLGLINGDFFPRVVAFSPGFVVGGTPHGKPSFFISHGTADPILPIDQCSRVIVPSLRQRGYDVTFREFEGRHEMPADIAGDAMRWVARM